ncbi:hydrolase (had superfamily) [Alkalihalobacillus hwajinpoensis]|uniref:HAD family hydrolase n=1 Tax=Guptibacillus hwajinpoensis TaxID=208199 RepID=UPI0018832EA8|nr:HAD family hydrolase [Pseudalkalibacillus hwajinpoensis]MBF0709331.1 hydrolase (had superfamily) [Pseudalkalibacillus hwajinpoensis]
MRAFASDLDRTLIYSSRMIEQDTQQNYELIETLDGKEISYISNYASELLQKVNKEIYFIPVTTRTVEQYRRITFFQTTIQPEYAITSNGGRILKNGKVLSDWSNRINASLEECLSLDAFVRQLENLIKGNWVERIRHADYLFVYLIIKRDHVSSEELYHLFEWSREQGWQPSLQGRKLYFVPNPVNKWKAVDYLKKEIGLSYVYTAGDSLLDYELIYQGDCGYVPAHGEVLESYPDLPKTTAHGMKASEEILDSIVVDLSLKKESVEQKS